MLYVSNHMVSYFLSLLKYSIVCVSVHDANWSFYALLNKLEKSTINSVCCRYTSLLNYLIRMQSLLTLCVMYDFTQ